MVADMQIPVMLGERSCWIDVEKTLETDDESVTFNIPANTGYGYKLFLKKVSSSATLPKQIGEMDFSVDGEVTINLTKVTAAQNGTKAKLRAFM